MASAPSSQIDHLAQLTLAAAMSPAAPSARTTTTRRGTRTTRHAAVDSLQALDDAGVWRADEADDGAAKSPPPAAAAAAVATGRTTRAGAKRASSSASTASRPAAKRGKPAPGLMDDPALAHAIEEARYEAYVDPYRGIVPYFALSYGDDDDAAARGESAISQGENGSPWERCQGALHADAKWGFINGEEGVVTIDHDDEDNDDTAALAVECGCPTVDGWARDELVAYNKEEAAKQKKKKQKGRGKKRKKGNDAAEDDEVVTIEEDEGKEGEGADGSATKGPKLFCGDRIGGEKTMHPCDYNPFCLASLGGMVDEYRHCAAKVRHGMDATPAKLAELIRNKLTEDLASSSSQMADENDEDGPLRRSSVVDRGVVADHVERFRCGDMHDIQSMHEQLVFRPESDRVDSTASVAGKLTLSTPPGLRNLGATCYLNSQLQCLAQNLGFVRGLFSWREPASMTSELERRMATVLTCMQGILGRMRYGPDRVICTNEFSTALGLENDEMQDPNEFARLLFDRMQESFSQSAMVMSQPSEVGNLLPSIFGGTFSYITECSGCGGRSERRENFSDLTLPIVDAEEEEASKKRPRKRNKADKSTVGDTDVQLCMNAYLHPESLSGDNQYECSGCGKKCDATRKVVFANLPPVLNIQLARYVFDKETFSKRKLKTKVLLPKTLTIPKDSTSDGSQQPEYILCAVQNHLGDSAHGGHYVADVMDWSTGIWHEFNDEAVTVLEHGPKSSFGPVEAGGDAETTKQSKPRKVDGSGDAYNLFYVRRSYLAEKSESELQHFLGRTGESCVILADMEEQRDEKYDDEKKNHEEKSRKNDRIRFRRAQIIEKLFHPTSNLVVAANSEAERVWIDGHFLRRFFSCHDGLEDIFQLTSMSSFLSRASYTCEHASGLNPRDAREGKLLHPDVYNALERIVQDEYSMYTCVSGRPLIDRKFVDDGQSLICQDCGKSYQQESRCKFELFQLLLSIRDDLLAGKNDLDQRKISDPSDVFVVSRTFATSLRTYVEKKVKLLKSMMSEKKSSEKSKTNHCGGLGMLDLREVQASEENDEDDEHPNANDAKGSDQADTKGSFKGEDDPTSKITCQHDCCPTMHSRTVRLIPADVWQKLVKVFPEATPHKFELSSDDAMGNCTQCKHEKEEEDTFLPRLRGWNGKIGDRGPLQSLFARGETDQLCPSDMIETFLQVEGSDKMALHALHHIDVTRWRDSVKAVAKALKSRKKIDAIKSQLNELLYYSSESSPGREWKFRSLLCEAHQLAVGLPSVSEEEDVRSWLAKVKGSNIELLLEEEYQELMGSLSSLESILHGDHSDPREKIRSLSILIRWQKGKPTITIDPQLCSGGCPVTSFSDECMENGMLLPKPQQIKQSKPEKDPEPVDQGPKGPLCKALVHEIEDGNDIEVAAAQIQLDLDRDNGKSTSSNGRPRRSRAARGGTAGGFPLHELEMALDANLAHFRLLLHQSKGKKLAGQHLYLLRSGASDSGQGPEELVHGSNAKTLHEIIHGVPAVDEEKSPDQPSDCTVHLILSYGRVGSGAEGFSRKSRNRMSQEEKQKEEALMASLAETSCGGWKTEGASETVPGGKKTKRRCQERGFQGTFLQSSSGLDTAVAENSGGHGGGGATSPQNAEEVVPEQPKQDGHVVVVDTPIKCIKDDATEMGNGDIKTKVDEKLARAREHILSKIEANTAAEEIESIVDNAFIEYATMLRSTTRRTT